MFNNLSLEIATQEAENILSHNFCTNYPLVIFNNYDELAIDSLKQTKFLRIKFFEKLNVSVVAQ